MLTWKRVLRTASSERYLAFDDAKQVGMVDLHFLPGGSVHGTVVLLPREDGSDAGWTEEQIPDLLASLDEDQLPTADMADGNFSYTVVSGTIIGRYETGQDDEDDEG